MGESGFFAAGDVGSSLYCSVPDVCFSIWFPPYLWRQNKVKPLHLSAVALAQSGHPAGGLATPKMLRPGWWGMSNGTGHGCDRSVGATGSQVTCKSITGPSGSQSSGQRFCFLGHLTIPWDDGGLQTRKRYLACDYCKKWSLVSGLCFILKNFSSDC